MSSPRPLLSRVSRLTAAMILIAAVPAVAQSARRGDAGRVWVSLNGGAQMPSRTFTETSTLVVNREDGQVTADYTVRNAALFDVGGSVKVTSKLRVALAVSSFASKSGVDVAARLPHPLFFDRLRDVSGTASGLTRKETAVHLDAMFALRARGGLDVHVFGGPTFFSVGQDLISDVRYTETYPFDSATFAGTPTTRVSKSVVGFNAGADVARYLTRRFGVGGLVRFSGATARLGSPLGGSVSVKAGGAEVAGGVRLRF